MKITGMWMWPENVRLYGTEKVLDYCVRAKITDLYFLTKGLAGTTQFRSKIAPCTYDGDLLGDLLDSAHKKGIRVHAWFTSGNDEHYKALHPESGRYHFSRGKDKGLISLVDEGYLNYMTQVVRELARSYPIDGLHLDYIRYNHLLYGWSEADKVRYEREGADTKHLTDMIRRMFYADAMNEDTLMFDAYRSGDESALALARARRKDVVHFAGTLADAARAENSKLILSAALMPEGAYDDVAFSDLHYGQNYEDAARIYDYALPMAYSQAYEKNGEWVRMVAEGTMKRRIKTIVGLHAYEGGTGLTLCEDIDALKNSAIEGICLFREGATALAFADGTNVSVYNPLKADIDRLIFSDGVKCVTVTDSITPGEEKQFSLPFVCTSVRAFSGESELSIYLT